MHTPIFVVWHFLLGAKKQDRKDFQSQSLLQDDIAIWLMEYCLADFNDGNDFLITSWQQLLKWLPDDSIKIDTSLYTWVWLPDNCLNSTITLPDICLITAWQLLEDYLMTAWWLTANWLTTDCLMTALTSAIKLRDNCLTTAWRLPKRLTRTNFLYRLDINQFLKQVKSN